MRWSPLSKKPGPSRAFRTTASSSKCRSRTKASKTIRPIRVPGSMARLERLTSTTASVGSAWCRRPTNGHIHPSLLVHQAVRDSARWSGEQDFTCCYFAPMAGARVQDVAYREGAAQRGQTLSPGQGQGLLRFLYVGKTREAAYEKVEKCIVPFFSEFASHFFPVLLSEGSGSMLERVLNTGLIVAGTGR